LRSGGSTEVPRLALLLLRIKPLRNLGARFIALGFRPERVSGAGTVSRSSRRD
jgi:hypothetical protein